MEASEGKGAPGADPAGPASAVDGPQPVLVAPVAAPPGSVTPPTAPPGSAPPPVAPDELRLPLGPSRLRRLVIDPFFAGVVGGGAFLWLLVLIISLHETRVFTDFGNDAAPTITLALLPSVLLAVLLGYRTSPRDGGALVGRVLGALFYGGLSALALLLFVVSLDSHARSREQMFPMMILGGSMATFALYKVRGLWPESRRRRGLVLAAAFAVLGLTPWSVSPGLQCLTGRAESCRRAAEDSFDSGLAAEGVIFEERGCYHGSREACAAAASFHQRGAGVPRDLLRAESFSQRACAAGRDGDEGACRSLRLVELEAACDHYRVFACKELASDYRSGTSGIHDDQRATRLFQKACLLGDDGSCH